MGALDALLRYKQQKDAEATADVSAIPQALMLYQQGKQQALDNTLKTLTLQGTLAKSGIGIGPNNQLVPDDRFVDSLKSLKAQDLLSKIKSRNSREDILNKFMGGVDSGNFPPGTTLNSATGALTIPLNQKLTDTEQSSVAGVEKFDPLVKEIESYLNQGVFEKGEGVSGNVKRLYQQTLAESGDNPISRILTKDESTLEKLSSAAAEMKKFAFQEGGKALSKTEKKIVTAGLSFVGKSDAQAIKDFNAAVEILRSKKTTALGGANAVKESNKDSIQIGTQRQLKSGGTATWDGKGWRID